ncbi:MAG: hypothetical protein AAF843_10295 [Bacteroidota bacterium]
MSIRVTNILNLEELTELSPQDWVIVKQVSTGKDKRMRSSLLQVGGSTDSFLYDPNPAIEYSEGQIREYNNKYWEWVNPTDGNTIPTVSNTDWEEVELANESVTEEWSDTKTYRRHGSTVKRNGGLFALRDSVDLPYKTASFVTADWESLSSGGGGGGDLSQQDVDTIQELEALVVGLAEKFDSKLNVSDFTPPIANADSPYADIAARDADQANQTVGYFYEVTDASADATVDSGGAVYQLREIPLPFAGTQLEYVKWQEDENNDFVLGSQINSIALLKSFVSGLQAEFDKYLALDDTSSLGRQIAEISNNGALKTLLNYLTEGTNELASGLTITKTGFPNGQVSISGEVFRFDGPNNMVFQVAGSIFVLRMPSPDGTKLFVQAFTPTNNGDFYEIGVDTGNSIVSGLIFKTDGEVVHRNGGTVKKPLRAEDDLSSESSALAYLQRVTADARYYQRFQVDQRTGLLSNGNTADTSNLVAMINEVLAIAQSAAGGGGTPLLYADLDASSGNLPTVGSGDSDAIRVGDRWLITVAGTLSDGTNPDVAVEINDVLTAKTANANDLTDFVVSQGNSEIATQGEAQAATNNVKRMTPVTSRQQFRSLISDALLAILQNVEEAFTTVLKDKLDNIQANATANATNAALRDRSTHTGTQELSTISDAGSIASKNFWQGTQSAYDAIVTKDADTLYFITG